MASSLHENVEFPGTQLLQSKICALVYASGSSPTQECRGRKGILELSHIANVDSKASITSVTARGNPSLFVRLKAY